MRNGISYGGSPGEGSTTNAGLSARAVMDAKGNNIKDTYRKVNASMVNTKQPYEMRNAGAHNSIFMGRDITDQYVSEKLFKNIRNGSFDDLWIGDYFKETINNKLMTCRLAGFNTYRNGMNGTIKNHAVIVTDEYFMTAKMNSTNTVEGAYKGTELYKNQIPLINGYLKSAIGEDHLVTLTDWLTNAVDADKPSAGYREWTTCSSSWTPTESLADLMSEVEVYGTRVWSSSHFDIGIGFTQLPLFFLAPEFINPSRFSWWLRGVEDSSRFPSNNGYNHIGDNVGTSLHVVRPRWCIG